MKNIKRILLVLVCLALACTFCFAVNAEGEAQNTDDILIDSNAGEGNNQNEEQGQNGQAPTQSTFMKIVTMLFPILILVAFFYFGMYKPQKKQEKEKKAMMDSLAVGSDVMTIGGIMGRIVSVKDDSVIIESGSDKNKLQISKQAISTVMPKEN